MKHIEKGNSKGQKYENGRMLIIIIKRQRENVENNSENENIIIITKNKA